MGASRVPLSSTANGTVLQKVSSGFVPAPGAAAHVYLHDPNSTLWGGANVPVAASVFSTELGAGVLSQPLVADANGELPGWVNDGQDLDVVASFGGQTSGPGVVEPVLATDLVPVSQKGAANGVGTLDGTGRQPIAQAPLSVVSVSSTNTAPLALSIVGSSLADVQAKAAAALTVGTPYFFAEVDSSGTLLDFGSGVV